jgi:hypothetical protein
VVGSLKAGDIVRSLKTPGHSLGKVVHTDGAYAYIYFKGKSDPVPEARVVGFRLPVDFLEIVTGASDPELDNLPPYADKKFRRAVTSLTFEKAKSLFLKAYPLGFNDPAYLAPLGGERAYKVAAHERFLAAGDLGNLAQTGTGEDIRAALSKVYMSDDTHAVESLNLLHPRWEAPAFFSSLDDTDVARAYLHAALGFIACSDAASFEAYATSIEKLGGGSGSDRRTGRWPAFSWLPFIADPKIHMMVRPAIVTGFASILPFDIRFPSHLEYDAYARVLRMSKQLLSRVADSELNLSRRSLDMIDLQSFMWVVQRYFEPGALEAS